MIKIRNIGSTIPDDVFEVLDRERGFASMSAFVKGLLTSYVQVVREEEQGEKKKEIIEQLI